MSRIVVALLLLLGAAQAGGLPADAIDFAWDTRTGAQVPGGTILRDENGKTFQLDQAFGSAPVILDIGYFHCPALCGVVRADLLNALRESGLVAGRDYTLISLSIDPAETPADASRAKAADLAQTAPASGGDWHYLVGEEAQVDAVTRAVGFRSRYDPEVRQFLHPAGLAVLTTSGVVSGYLLGVGFTGGDLRAAVLRAGQGGIAQSVLPVLLLCFHYDETTGRYTLAIEKVLRLMAALTVMTLAGMLLVLHRQRPP